MTEIRWLGRGGQGAFTAARLLALSASIFEGTFALAFPAFGPERRGAAVSAFTRISSGKITDRSEIREADALVVLDDTLVSRDLARAVKPGGTLYINTSDPGKFADFPVRTVTLDAMALAIEILGIPASNTAMLGLLVSDSGVIRPGSAESGIRREMKPHLAERNVDVFRKAANAERGRTR
jgi:pyruvate ferredoxin oxidoreductase gamma subunit